MDRLAGDVDAGEVAADDDDLAQRLVDALLRDDGDVEGTVPSGKPRPSLISVCSARETTSREASSILFGAYFSMKRSPSALQQVRALAAGALGDQEARCPASVVGWYWIISMSISGAPTR